jgi:hypothetical protein
MDKGAALVIPGSIFGSIALVLLLLSITAGFTFPPSVTEVQASGIADENQTQDHSASDSSQSNSTCSVSNQFPGEILQWCGLITHYANLRGLNPDLVAALILQESAGNPVAYSKSGAVGLMQVMPRDGIASTFMCVNGPCFRERPSIAELENPEFNISYGTKMLAGLITKHGNLRDALKSYGPMDVGYYYADIVLAIFERNRSTN